MEVSAKQINFKKPLISIVTIVYNGITEIENTIKSVINQTYSNIEYIIIDGGSNDGTVEIIKKYSENISYWKSEKDDGIYYAMNKGNRVANGEYIMFLNSGDFFTDENVIENIFNNLNGLNYSLITGRTAIYYKNQYLEIVSPPKTKVLNELSESFSHQATFISKSIYKNFSYNTMFKISADREYWFRIKKSKNFEVKFLDLSISSFGLGGVSNNHKNILNRRLEDLYIEYIYYGVNYKRFSKMILKTIATYFITLNENFYYKKIYVLKNKFDEKEIKR